MPSVSVAVEDIGSRILLVRGQKVLLDSDLAAMYGVPTKRLIQAIKRNVVRFPPDFVYRLTDQQLAGLRSQIVTSNPTRAGRGGRRWAYYAFTEQGVAMLSSVLHSTRAIAVNVAIMRAFVRMRQIVSANAELTKKLDELERRVAGASRALEIRLAPLGACFDPFLEILRLAQPRLLGKLVSRGGRYAIGKALA